MYSVPLRFPLLALLYSYRKFQNSGHPSIPTVEPHISRTSQFDRTFLSLAFRLWNLLQFPRNVQSTNRPELSYFLILPRNDPERMKLKNL